MIGKSVFLVCLLLFCSRVFADGKTTAQDKIQALTASVDSFILQDSPNITQLERLEATLQYLNWNNYYEQYGSEGPVRKLLNYCRKHELISGEISCLNGLGVMLRQMGQPAEAEELHLSALTLAKESRDTLAMLISLNNLGVNARRIDDLKKATDYHVEVLDLVEKSSVKTGIVKKSMCIALNSLGNINISLKQYDKAIDIFKQSNKIERSMDSSLGQAINMANIGEAFEQSGRIDSARYYYEQSLLFNQKIGSVLGIALCNNNLGNICLKRHDYDKAISHFMTAIELVRTTGDKYHLAISLESAARAWIARKQYSQAASLLDEAISLSKVINAKILQKEGYQMFSKISNETGKYHEALDYLTLSHQYSDSIFNEENQRHLNEIQTRYETEKKEQQIVLLNKEQELNHQHLRAQRLFLWGLAILSLLVVAVISLLYRQQQIQAKNREVELSQKLLRSQMNPHFLFNSLGAIQHFMMKNDGRKAAFYLSSFSSLMRSILKNSREELITLDEEKQTLENYLNLHKLRLGDKLSYSVSVAEDLDPEMVLLPPMLVQPFVENAIIHGIEKIEGNGFLTISFGKENGWLKITVEDNGPGIQKQKPDEKEHKSYALDIFKERVGTLKKAYGIDCSYRLENLVADDGCSRGARVTVSLTLMNA